MSQERIKILNMLKEGKISAEEADALLSTIQENSTSENHPGAQPKSAAKFLRILVDADENGKGKAKAKVNVKVPLALLRTGIKLGSLFPDTTKDMDSKFSSAFKDRGLHFNFSKMSNADLEAFIAALQESEIVIDANQEGKDSAKIRLFCE